MNDSSLANPKLSDPHAKSTRVDPAHELLDGDTADGDLNTWLSVAGRDPAQVNQQLHRQTNEIMSYAEQRSEEIDSRQAELNAKLAQLDHELRKVRLQTAKDAGQDLLSGSPDAPDVHRGVATKNTVQPSEATERQFSSFEELPEQPKYFTGTSNESELIPEARLPEFEDVERVVAKVTKQIDEQTTASDAMPKAAIVPPEQEASMTDPMSDSDWPDEPALGPDEPAAPELRQLGSVEGLDPAATSVEIRELESGRRLLAERSIELDRRKAVLQRMQDETQAVHREALEMRLVTEQLWTELSQKAPTEHLTQLLTSLRARLDNHYKSMNQTLTERKSELDSLQGQLRQKQDEIRQQSRKLQEWVECRHDEIKAKSAQQDARELLLDRREHCLQDEFAKWEAQRRQYKQQLQGLLQKISLAGLRDVGR